MHMLLRKFQTSHLIWLILLLSLVFHLMFYFKNPGWIFQVENVGENVARYGATDAFNYTLTAEQLMEKKVFSFVYLQKPEDPKPGAYITPAQPLLIAGLILLGKLLSIDFVQLGIWFNMALSISTIFILYKICLELFQNKWIGLFSAFLYSIYLGPYHYFRTLLTETPSIFLLCLSVLLFIKAWKYNKKLDHILFGIVFSILLMFRPNPAPIVLIGILIIVRTYGIKKSLKIGLYWAIGPILIILPWVIRNWISLDEFVLFSTQSGNPLLAGADPFNKTGPEAIYKEMQSRGFTNEKEYAIVRITEGLRYDFTYWFSWMTLGKFIELYRIPSPIASYVDYTFYKYLQPVHNVIIGAGFITSLYSLMNYAKAKKVASLVFVFLTYTAFSVIFLAIDRYGFFIIPILTIIAGFGIYHFVIEPLYKLLLKAQKKQSFLYDRNQ